jgi:pyrrolysine biosynthesis protein PylC
MQVTCLEFDEGYGCKRVIAPWPYEYKAIKETLALGEKVVEGLHLTGLTDVQVVVREDGRVEIIEANARLPSQTPTVVYHSTGVNMVELLADLFLRERLPSYEPKHEKVVIYQHVLIKDGKLKIVAERELSNAKRFLQKVEK